MASVKNLASGVLASGINTTDTTLVVSVGSGSASTQTGVWPTPPFFVTVAPDSPSAGVSNSLDSEIMSITAIASDGTNVTMTATRAQRDTTAKAFNAGAVVTNAVYAEDAVLLGPDGTTESPSPWIKTSDIEDGAVTSDKIDWSTVPTFIAYVSGTAVPDGNKLTLGLSTAGPGFSLSNNELVCGFNSDYVLFVFQGAYTSGSGIRLMKNGVEQRAAYAPGANASMILFAGLSVSNGDEISLECFGGAATVYPYSYLYAFKIR
jgi:hypothetical protein